MEQDTGTFTFREIKYTEQDKEYWLQIISKNQAFLSSTDYVVIKIAEGTATTADYQEVINKRQQARVLINQAQEKLKEYD